MVCHFLPSQAKSIAARLESVDVYPSSTTSSGNIIHMRRLNREKGHIDISFRSRVPPLPPRYRHHAVFIAIHLPTHLISLRGSHTFELGKIKFSVPGSVPPIPLSAIPLCNPLTIAFRFYHFPAFRRRDDLRHKQWLDVGILPRNALAACKLHRSDTWAGCAKRDNLSPNPRLTLSLTDPLIHCSTDCCCFLVRLSCCRGTGS
jgi:hypothetical protein